MMDEHQEFESHIRAVAADFAYPPTPELRSAARVEPRVARRRLAWAAALLVAMGVIVAGVPPVRAAVTEVLGIGSVRITLGGPTPTASAGLLFLSELPGETTLEAARTASSVPLALPGYPADLGPPDRVFLLPQVGDTVVLVWEVDSRTDRAQLALYVIPPGPVIDKLGPQSVEQTTVGGVTALWTTGDHFLQLITGDPQQQFLVSGNVLVWTEDGVTYRLETELPLDEAVRIGESLE